ncbi:hypothetical protein D3C87_1577130 [compost metagenome]
MSSIVSMIAPIAPPSRPSSSTFWAAMETTWRISPMPSWVALTAGRPCSAMARAWVLASTTCPADFATWSTPAAICWTTEEVARTSRAWAIAPCAMPSTAPASSPTAPALVCAERLVVSALVATYWMAWVTCWTAMSASPLAWATCSLAWLRRSARCSTWADSSLRCRMSCFWRCCWASFLNC